MARENQNECAGEEDEKVLTREVATPAAREDPTAVFSHPPPQPRPHPPETPGFQRLSLRPTDRPTARSIDGPHASSLSSPSIKQDAAATSPPLFIKLEMLQVGNPPLKSNIRKTGPCASVTSTQRKRTMEYLGAFPHRCPVSASWPHLELRRRLQGAEVGRGGDPVLQGLQEDPLEVQHLRQAAEQAFHLGGGGERDDE